MTQVARDTYKTMKKSHSEHSELAIMARHIAKEEKVHTENCVTIKETISLKFIFPLLESIYCTF